MSNPHAACKKVHLFFGYYSTVNTVQLFLQLCNSPGLKALHNCGKIVRKFRENMREMKCKCLITFLRHYQEQLGCKFRQASFFSFITLERWRHRSPEWSVSHTITKILSLSFSISFISHKCRAAVTPVPKVYLTLSLSLSFLNSSYRFSFLSEACDCSARNVASWTTDQFISNKSSTV